MARAAPKAVASAPSRAASSAKALAVATTAPPAAACANLTAEGPVEPIKTQGTAPKAAKASAAEHSIKTSVDAKAASAGGDENARESQACVRCVSGRVDGVSRRWRRVESER